MARRSGFSAGLILLGAAFLAACGGAPPPPPDGGAGASNDAGSPPVDAGKPAPQGWPDCPYEAPSVPPCTGTTLLEKLACVPGLTVTAWSPPDDPTSVDFTLTQPVDHLHPSGPTFEQYGHLEHVGFDAPLVLSATGYDLFDLSASELTMLFTANELHVEYRFFGQSAPAPVPWALLDVQEASADLHALREAFKWIYPARWVSTGISKGGMTMMHYRQAYPCDVDGTVAYSAPNSFGASDPGYRPFLDAVGGTTWASCRQSLRDAQRLMLNHRAELVALLPTSGFTMAGSADRALEHTVLELGFAFWQYTWPDDAQHGCPAIPGASATPAQLLAFLNWHVGVTRSFGDTGVAEFVPYYYQAATQLGGPAPYETPVSDLLSYPGTYVASAYAPKGVTLPAFDAAAMPLVQQWLSTSGTRVLLINGEFDPWNARHFELGTAPSTARYVVAGGNHGASIGQLSSADAAAATALVRAWVSLP
jgi:hypothetical protein